LNGDAESQIQTDLRADAIVVAAGESRRMAGTDKLMAEIAGRPLLAWTLRALSIPEIERIVVVGSLTGVAEWPSAPWMPRSVVYVVAGGDRRQDSVAAGVAALERLGPPDDRVVLVHDGARPAVDRDLILRVIRAASKHGAAIPILPIEETIKRVDDSEHVVETIDRVGLGTAQTPQGAHFRLLRDAFRRFPAGSPEVFTDEAGLLAECRIPVHAVRGELGNVKVTHEEDLGRAASVLEPAGPRIGLGHDSHPFGPGGPMALGGLVFDAAPRLKGHSDGDVVLHAVADALLGAASLGDLGRVFPADQRTPSGIDSGRLLERVVAMVREAGLTVGHIDVTIVGARPRLGPRLDEVRARIADLIGIPVDAVSVKASTGNLDGLEGTGRGISAHAVVSLVDSG
jgi:2-C-methyl-D-erythritol 4-phosphate cytidylyltransferase/2-C-methyl-D-erythritol 2,4-cyclodiphosphate synthase